MKAVCDLCHHQPPSVYCSSDSAFLCSDCDSKVHTANFLVARHIRVPISSDCHDQTEDAMSSSSTVCNSGSTSSTTSSSDRKARDVLVSWCSRLGVVRSASIIEVAGQAFQVWWPVNRSYHYRVGLAGSLWLGLLKDDGYKNKVIRLRTLLKRLEVVSGVPARTFVLEQLRLAAKLKHDDHPPDQEEGWAES
ncbi:hypothetical protein R6Q59_036272 [Mikania micrantha]|uniref:B box-type domain-containing protein n=1 Tax=Mikania micrantha TaxID=192012 RepID=A0A5N6NCG3_9ASTR|nr:hypothetical protein E3N88_22531 [Mikania micrantha]